MLFLVSSVSLLQFLLLTYLLTYLLELPVVTDDEFVGVALTARHLHYDTRMGANASTRVTSAAATHVYMSLYSSMMMMVMMVMVLMVMIMMIMMTMMITMKVE